MSIFPFCLMFSSILQHHFYTPWKRQKTFRFLISDVFRGSRNGAAEQLKALKQRARSKFEDNVFNWRCGPLSSIPAIFYWFILFFTLLATSFGCIRCSFEQNTKKLIVYLRNLSGNNNFTLNWLSWKTIVPLVSPLSNYTLTTKEVLGRKHCS